MYLQAPVDTLLYRIARRGIDYEQRIDRRYLARLNEAYARFFHDYDEAPLLIVNAAIIDPVHNDADFGMLLEEIGRMRSGRHFFNPRGLGIRLRSPCTRNCSSATCRTRRSSLDHCGP